MSQETKQTYWSKACIKRAWACLFFVFTTLEYTTKSLRYLRWESSGNIRFEIIKQCQGLIFPALKMKCEFSTSVSSRDYYIWMAELYHFRQNLNHTSVMIELGLETLALWWTGITVIVRAHPLGVYRTI